MFHAHVKGVSERSELTPCSIYNILWRYRFMGLLELESCQAYLHVHMRTPTFVHYDQSEVKSNVVLVWLQDF